MWKKFEAKIEINSLATEFGPFHCEKTHLLGLMKAIIFVGRAVGCLVIMYLADNQNKRWSFLASLGLMAIGNLGLFVSSSLIMACFCLFLIGLGISSTEKLGLTIINEVSSA